MFNIQQYFTINEWIALCLIIKKIQKICIKNPTSSLVWRMFLCYGHLFDDASNIHAKFLSFNQKFYFTENILLKRT